MPFTDPSTPVPRERGLFCNRTLNMRAIRAIGYDMDYTLVHYHIEAWEQRAYDHLKQRLAALGLPVANLAFDPSAIIRGLVIDTERGNIVKANRFGYVKRAFHGTSPLAFEALRQTYAREVVDLSEPRWVFLNTLFSLSEAHMYAQLVDLYDRGELTGISGYHELYELTRKHIDLTHMEGELKAEIVAHPDRYVDLDPDAAVALLDQKAAGKRLVLVTNSEWSFTAAMMRYAFDPFLPEGTTWRDLFELVVVAANKPAFFERRNAVLEVVTDDGLLKPHVGLLAAGKCYFGGDAVLVERSLGVSGDEILYVGDHIFGDVHVSKNVLRWRTCLVVRELEQEIHATIEAEDELEQLAELMQQKEALEREHCECRLRITRRRAGYGPALPEGAGEPELSEHMASLRQRIADLDAVIAPLAKRASELVNASWGPLMWAGNDKSHYARQIERYADVYTSRVSNFALATPFVYLRSPRGMLPHDVAPAPAAGRGAYSSGPPSRRSAPR